MCTVGLLEEFVQLYGKYMLHKMLYIANWDGIGCFVHAHHDHQTEWNEDTAYELGEGGEGRSRGRTNQGLDKVSVLLTTNNPLKSPSGPIMDSCSFW